jgi:hypothetical protein
MSFSYAELIERRQDLSLPGYKSLADVDFDGPWITPYQKAVSLKRRSGTGGPALAR